MPIPIDRKARLFCWTEVGAEYVVIIQNLMTIYWLQGINSFIYLVDVLHRIAIQPGKNIEALTSRRWETSFANNPMRFVLHLDTQ